VEAQFTAGGILKRDEMIVEKPGAFERFPPAVRIHQKDEK